MEKPFKIIILIVLGIVIFQLLFSVFGSNKNIKSVIDKLEKSRANVDSALNEIKNSQDKLKAMQEDLNKFSLYIKDIQGRVEIDDMEKSLKDITSKKKVDSIKALIKKTKEELLENDSLPEIIIK